MQSSKFHSSPPVAMESLVSYREYDLHFADPSSSSEVSMVYLKLTEGSLRDIEQVVRALNCSRSPAPPPIRLEMGDNLSGTFTLPQVRGDDVIATNSDSSGASFSVSLAPQNTSVDLLHTLTTYPTHEVRSHPPGTRRMSLGSPPEPEIFLKFLGPIGHRLSVRAVAGEAFDRTRSKFNELNEISRNYGARQLQRVPGPLKRGLRPEFGRNRPFNRAPVSIRPSGPRFIPPRPRPVQHNGLHSPTRDPAPVRVHGGRKLTSPPQQQNHRLPGPSAAPAPPPPPATVPRAGRESPLPPAATPHLGRESPALKKRPPSTDSDAETAEPAPKRGKREKRNKRHKACGAEELLSKSVLEEISNFQELDCKWSDLYPDILSPEIRAKYRRTYDECLPSYKKLREKVESNIRKISVCRDKLTQLDSQGPEHRRMKKKATRLCQQNDELRRVHSFLHEKLSVVKRQIEQFDKSL